MEKVKIESRNPPRRDSTWRSCRRSAGSWARPCSLWKEWCVWPQWSGWRKSAAAGGQNSDWMEVTEVVKTEEKPNLLQLSGTQWLSHSRQRRKPLFWIKSWHWTSALLLHHPTRICCSINAPYTGTSVLPWSSQPCSSTSLSERPVSRKLLCMRLQSTCSQAAKQCTGRSLNAQQGPLKPLLDQFTMLCKTERD